MAILGATLARAQNASGALAGKITDGSGKPLLGAQVTVTSSHLQGPRTMITDEEGEFLIPYLPPADDYEVAIDASGFNRVVRSKIAVRLGTTTVLDTALSVSGQEVQVTASPSLLDLKEGKISTNFTQSELEDIPINRSFQDAFYLAPNVVDSGVAGGPGVSGSTSTENVYVFDGINITDPVGGILVPTINYNFIREISVNTAGLSAEYGASTGGLFNAITKSGSNQFHGELFAYYTDQSFAASADPILNSPPSSQPYHQYDYGFDLGGPVIKDRLWFFAGYNAILGSHHHEGESLVTNTMFGNQLALPYRYDDTNRQWLGMAKLTFKINDEHYLELTAITTPAHQWFNEGAVSPGLGNILGSNATVPMTDERARMTRRYLSGYNAGLKWYANWAPNFYMETEIGRVHQEGQILPWDDAGYGLPEIMSYDWYPTVSVGAGTGTMFWDTRDSTQLSAKVTYLIHRHEIKWGVEDQELKWDNYNGYTGGVRYAVAGNMTPDPFSANLGDYAYVFANSLENPHAKENGRYVAAFAQDTWSVTDYLNLAYGVRWERNQLLPQSGQDAAFDSWSPRVGLTWDFTGKGKSKVYANWGRYYERVPIAATYLMDPGHESYYDAYFMGMQVSHYTFGSVPMTVLPGTKNQYNDEFVAGIQYDVLPDFTLGFSALYRSLGRVLEDVGYLDQNGTFSYYLMNPGGNQWPAVMSAWSSVLPDYEPFPHPIRNYSAYTITATRHFKDRWYFNASYTLSYLKGNYEGGSGGYSTDSLAPTISSAYDFPEHIFNENRYGYLPQDVRNLLKAQGGYRFDWGLSFGVNLTVQSGRPLSKTYQYPLSGPGSGTLFAAPRDSDRLPGNWHLDLHAEYAHATILKTQMSLFFDLFNVTNRQTVIVAYDRYYQTPGTLADVFSGNLQRDYTWGQPLVRQSPRSVRVGVKLSF
jgi:hypothetical protein